ncbi:hypothetical protein GCM10017044_10530 [Kordiimonas sediminis]|uniref:Fe2OG dioxygenase domain-containing protein n=2 Tax=Kordiimonas sediminis TaxID=1735581 RepID=A0A919AR42_9PROT|nr:hypothetical protein GCM10017044_10530 [Kordiimonas sediminis]
MQEGAFAEGMKAAKLAGGTALKSVRSAESCWIDLEAYAWFERKMLRALSEITRTYFPFEIDGFAEGIQVLRYEGAAVTDGAASQPGDFYDWHSDVGSSGSTRSRKLTFVIQLSDPSDYSGGQLEVNTTGDACPLPTEQGTLVAFPAFALHRVTPVTQGTRWSLALWAHGPAFR